MSSSIDIIRAANKKETRRIKVELPVDDQVVTFYIAAKDTYQIWADQRALYWAERKRAGKDVEDKTAADTVALNVTASSLMREILPKYFRNEDNSPAYANKEELQEIIDLVSSDGAALNALSEAWVRLTSAVTRTGEKAKNL